MNTSLSLAGLVLLAAISTVSCDKFRPPMPESQKSPATTGQAAAQAGERSAFAQTAQKELDELKVTITEFKAKAQASGAETKDRLDEEVKKLEVDMDEAQDHLAALKAATMESWSQAKDAFGRSLEKLKSRVDNFRKTAG